jgi:hypothetical protein
MKTALLIFGGFFSVCTLVLALWLRQEAKHCPIEVDEG